MPMPNISKKNASISQKIAPIAATASVEMWPRNQVSVRLSAAVMPELAISGSARPSTTR